MRVLLFLCFFFSCFLLADPQESTFKQKLASLADNPSLQNIALSFLQTPYEAKTLEINDAEQLVVNFDGLDCTTYIENVLAFNQIASLPDANIQSFKHHLQRIRYRDGVLSRYESRLHYFTEWLIDNENKGYIKNITKKLGGDRLTKSINFMSTHRSAYPMLSNENIEDIRLVEQQLSQSPSYYLPIDSISGVKSQLQSGDIIAITTAIKGLDVTHTGFAWFKDSGELHLLHASTKKGVVVSELPLVDYLKQKKNNTGIVVARIL